MSIFKSRKFLVIVVVLIVLIIIVSSFVCSIFQRPYAGKVESITIGTIPNEVASLILIAKDQQYFSQNGLNVTIRNYQSGLEAVEGMLRGESDISGAAEFVFVGEVLKNESIYNIGNIGQYLSLYIVGRQDEGIINVSDLKGKTLGVAFGTSHQFFLGRFLELNRISTSQVTVLNIPFNEQPDALANGTVDAVITFQPYLRQIESRLANNTVVWSAQAGQPGYAGAFCTQSWASAHPEVIVRFLKALVRSENYNVNFPDQSMALVAKKLNYTSLYIQSVWKDYRFSVSLDQSFILLCQDEARWLVTNNLTNANSAPNILGYVYATGLLTVEPQATNIIG
jgi:ABC-type nitrate/sulfonate/bicarbonate transport system substrate-binding protein